MTRSMTRTVTRTVAMAMLSAALLGLTPPSSAGATGPGAERVPVLRADYRFHRTLASAVRPAPRLGNIRAAGNVANRFVGPRPRAVLRFPEGNGLSLARTGRVIRRGNYTIAIRMRFNRVDSYRRVVNFKGNQDTGLYVYDGDLALYDLDEPDNDVIVANRWVNITLTRNAATKRVRGYVNGVQQFNRADPDGLAVISGANVLRFFRDDSNREESAGAVARIRLWSGALTSGQVARL